MSTDWESTLPSSINEADAAVALSQLSYYHFLGVTSEASSTEILARCERYLRYIDRSWASFPSLQSRRAAFVKTLQSIEAIFRIDLDARAYHRAFLERRSRQDVAAASDIRAQRLGLAELLKTYPLIDDARMRELMTKHSPLPQTQPSAPDQGGVRAPNTQKVSTVQLASRYFTDIRAFLRPRVIIVCLGVVGSAYVINYFSELLTSGGSSAKTQAVHSNSPGHRSVKVSNASLSESSRKTARHGSLQSKIVLHHIVRTASESQDSVTPSVKAVETLKRLATPKAAKGSESAHDADAELRKIDP